MGATSGTPLIAGRGLTLEIGKRVILDHVDVEVRAGEIVTIIGPNGAGKSTLIRILLGLEKDELIIDLSRVQEPPTLVWADPPPRSLSDIDLKTSCTEPPDGLSAEHPTP